MAAIVRSVGRRSDGLTGRGIDGQYIPDVTAYVSNGFGARVVWPPGKLVSTKTADRPIPSLPDSLKKICQRYMGSRRCLRDAVQGAERVSLKVGLASSFRIRGGCLRHSLIRLVNNGRGLNHHARCPMSFHQPKNSAGRSTAFRCAARGHVVYSTLRSPMVLVVGRFRKLSNAKARLVPLPYCALPSGDCQESSSCHSPPPHHFLPPFGAPAVYTAPTPHLHSLPLLHRWQLQRP